MILANGLEYPAYPTYREAAATVIERKEGPGVLGVSLGRSLWRQLSAITVKRRAEKSAVCGPLALGNLDSSEDVTLWVGALATDQAKIEDVVEARFDVPAGMFQDRGRKLYEEGVAIAEAWQTALSNGVKAYAAALNLESAPTEVAQQRFWTAVEQQLHLLFSLVREPENIAALEDTEWGKMLGREVENAYAFACPHQSPRQIQAYAIGYASLRLPKPKSEPKPKRSRSISA